MLLSFELDSLLNKNMQHEQEKYNKKIKSKERERRSLSNAL